MPDDPVELHYAEKPRVNKVILARGAIIVAFGIGAVLAIPSVKQRWEQLRMQRLYSACLIASTERLPQSWIDLNRQFGIPVKGSEALFLGELHAPGANSPTLVGVTLLKWTPPVLTTEIRTFGRAPVSGGAGSQQSMLLQLSDTNLKFKHAAVDPADLSHFTIEYSTRENAHGTIDGWLKDQWTVVMEARNDGTTTAPAPPSAAKSR